MTICVMFQFITPFTITLFEFILATQSFNHSSHIEWIHVSIFRSSLFSLRL